MIVRTQNIVTMTPNIKPKSGGRSEKAPTGGPLWPADAVERWPIAKLIPYANNARTHSDAQVAQIAASIRQWGWTMPVLVDEAGTIIAGHGRVLAAHQLAIETVPVMVARGWSDTQRRLYTLADNKLALNADWDAGTLKLEMMDLRDMGVDLSLTGFADFELEPLFKLGVSDPDGEWDGMPAYDQPDDRPFRSIAVHFKDQAAVDAFAQLIEQVISEKAKYIWYPEAERERFADKRYVDEP
jgi:ParB-like chromosome segregation protein Spo0J